MRLSILEVSVVSGLVLIAAVLVSTTLDRDEVPTYEVTPAAPDDIGARLVGPTTYTVDASDPDRWVFFDFSRGSVVPDGRGAEWDLAFRRSEIIVNGGEGFGGEAGVVDLGDVPFDSVDTVPPEGYEGTVANRDSVQAALKRWYDYSFTSHILDPRPAVFAVRTADGRFAKMRILSFYCPGAVAGCVTFEYVYQGGPGRAVGR